MSYFKLYEAKRNKNKHLNVGELWQWDNDGIKYKFNTICITKIQNDLVHYRYLFGHLATAPEGFGRGIEEFLLHANPLCQKVDCHTT
jgi:hypothetical protein